MSVLSDRFVVLMLVVMSSDSEAGKCEVLHALEMELLLVKL